MTVGCYAFVTRDYRELGYPLDLWLKWHLRVMDEVALVTYGTIYLPIGGHPKLRTASVDPPSPETNEFYLKGKSAAQDLLTTDYKVLLDCDEFIYRPDTSTLLPSFAYGLRYHNFYGSLEYTIVAKKGIPPVQYRIHKGFRQIIGDGGNVAPPFDTSKTFDVWHTNMCRDPAALSAKWKTQIEREIRMGYTADADRLPLLDGVFDYSRYADAFPGAEMHRVNLYSLPDILLQNRERFSWWKP